jgi:histidyl-tRNA synthetase
MPAIQPVKGTRDFYPEDLALRRWLYERLRAVAESFGYQEYDGPFLERLELYAAKLGQELVKEQSFVFPDRGGDLIALRPELTHSLARMVATRSATIPRPIRWWSFGPFWRYERPQKGRTREFFQWNVDLLGLDSPQADAELATVAASFFRSVGLSPKDIRILVNNRRLVDAQLSAMGIPTEQRLDILHLIDRRDRLAASQWQDEARAGGLSAGQFEALQTMLVDRQAWRQSEELVAFFAAAETMGEAQYLAYDPSVIRGLDYYTGTVFEARDAAGEYRAILGGGRYDDLVADIGGDPIPGVGFAMGDVVIGLVLEKYGRRPDLRAAPADVLVTTFDEQSIEGGLRIATSLRSAGIKVEWYPLPGRLPKQLKYADRQGIPFLVIQGPDERSANEVTVKDLRRREQTQVPEAELVSRLRAFLESLSGT